MKPLTLSDIIKAFDTQNKDKPQKHIFYDGFPGLPRITADDLRDYQRPF